MRDFSRFLYGDGVGLVWGAVLEGLLEQGFKGARWVKVALEVSVEAVGDGVGVGVVGAGELSDGFARGGDEFGEGELLVGVFGFGLWGVGVCCRRVVGCGTIVECAGVPCRVVLSRSIGCVS